MSNLESLFATIPTVPVKPGDTCPRCSGTGRTPHTHVLAGICFRCWGAGVELTEKERIAEAKLYRALTL